MDSELKDFLSDGLLEWLCDSSTTAAEQTCDAGPTQISSSSYGVEIEKEGLDALFLGALDAFERSTPGPSSRPFAAPVSEKDILQAKQRAVPEKTQRDTNYCVRLWDEWCTHRQRATLELIPPLTTLANSQLQHWMSRFVLE